MSDFLLDFRGREARRQSAATAVSLLKFTDATRVEIIERDLFSLVISRVDGFELWGPCEHHTADGNVLVALAGRIALDESEWEAARRVEAPGGLACKAILDKYLRGDIPALGALNGNFAVLIHDDRTKRLLLVTDRCGMFLAYRVERPSEAPVFCSHPDVLARITGEAQNWDKTSLAEFLMTSRVSFPYTYYQNLRIMESGCIFSVDLREAAPLARLHTRYFEWHFKTDPQAGEEDLAKELSIAFRNAVRRRTLPLFGCAGVGLSGGLDSRAILSCVDRRTPTRAFTLFDEENGEYNVARAIAEACGVPLIPIRREFEFYGNSAVLGVRASGGTGCITCNHFLGALKRLETEGIANVLTGCYCDYLFKGLALNRREQWLSRKDELNGFNFEFYDSFHWLQTPVREDVLARLNAQFPESTKPRLSDEDWLEVERKRTFPLACEQDLAQRVIPQRLMPWYVPAVDNEILDVYQKIPPKSKLNSSVFKKMLAFICPEKVLKIADNNTGAAINANGPGYIWARCSSALRNRMADRLQHGMATNGSWPSWRHYFCHSKVVESIWSKPNPAASDIFSEILGWNPHRQSICEYMGTDVVLFQRLLTQKLWLDQWLAG